MFDLKTRILVVDDMLTMRKLLAQTCREVGFTQVLEASDGLKAWETLSAATQPIGLVIADWTMSRCSGLELLKRVRADERLKKLPFLLLTADTDPARLQEAREAGLDDYIVKPCTAPVLREKLEALHARKTKAA